MLRKDLGSAQTGKHYWAGNCLFPVALAKWNEDVPFWHKPETQTCFTVWSPHYAPEDNQSTAHDNRGLWHMAARVLFLWLTQSIVLKHWTMLLCVTVMYTCIKVLKKSSLIIFLWCLSAVRSAWKPRQHRGSPSPAAHGPELKAAIWVMCC